MNIDSWIELNKQKIINLRRWLHRNPEIGFNEFNTASHLSKILSEAGYNIITNDKMKTGFYCDYNSGDQMLALRTDMDALEIQENNPNINYQSLNSGIMHACGHDVHMSILTAVALYMKESNALEGSVRFIFQPAEEQAPGGALSMIEGNALDKVSSIIGCHVYPKINAGKIAIKSGPIAATVELIDIELKGMGGHTSRPNESVDLVWAQSQLVNSLEQAINHGIDQQEPIVLAFGKVEGGMAHNVLPSKIILSGTLRYLNPDIKDSLYKKIDESIEIVSKMTRAEISWNSTYACPGVINDKRLTDLILQSSREVIGEDNVDILGVSSMGGEDFAYYLEKVPGAYFRVGSYDGLVDDIHTSDFNVDEECIFTGIKAFTSIVKNYFKS
tara:strand:- start:1517 stop:2677 length:1161 start_codon:yes stop_codon:yes gene_type:complete